MYIIIWQGFALWFDVFFPIFHHGTARKHSSATNGNGSSGSPPPPTQPDDTVVHDDNPTSDTKTQRKNHVSCCQRNGYSKCVVLSTSPYKPETHWKQSLLYLSDGCSVEQDSIIDANVTLTPCRENKRFLNIALTCKVDGGTPVSKSYFMGYEVPDSKRQSTEDNHKSL